MALLYPWATKEYLLWQMSLGQIIMYLNIGIDVKNKTSKKDKPKSLKDESYDKIKQIKKELKEQGLSISDDSDIKDELSKAYGDINAK